MNSNKSVKRLYTSGGSPAAKKFNAPWQSKVTPKSPESKSFTELKSRESEKASPADDNIDLLAIEDLLGELDGSFGETPAKVHDNDTEAISLDSEIPTNTSVDSLPLIIRSSVRNSSVLKLTCDVMAEKLSATDVFFGTVELSLHSFWAQAVVNDGDELNLIAARKFGGNAFDLKCLSNHYTLDDSTTYLLVTHPNTLVSATSVASSLFCQRKAVLSERVKVSGNSSNYAMVVGTLAHSMFQHALQRKITDAAVLDKFCKDLIANDLDMLAQLWALEVPPGKICQDLGEYAVQTGKWVTRFVVNRTPLGSDNVGPSDNSIDKSFTIEDIEDIEENIWCSQYGVRGKIDVSLSIEAKPRLKRIENRHAPAAPSFLTFPLELKTGKPTFGFDHIAQVSLYSLMLNSVRETQSEASVLLYLRGGETKLLKPALRELKGVMQARNDLSIYLAPQSVSPGLLDDPSIPVILPPPINEQRICSKCPFLETCYAFEKGFEQSLDEDHAISKLGKDQLSFFGSTELSYFTKWVRLVCLEWKTVMKRRSPMSDVCCPNARADGVNRVSNLVVDCVDKKENGFIIKLRKRTSEIFPAGVLSKNDYLILSRENRPHVAIASGTVSWMTEDIVGLRVDKMLVYSKTDTFRLDKYESFSSMPLTLGCLMSLFQRDNRSDKMRSLVIHLRVPLFREKLPRDVVTKAKPLLRHLNKEQIRSVLRVLLAEDYVLIHGMPGTGKTTTIACLVRLLALLGHKVLVVSYTHSAVDTILSKLIDDNEATIKILRLGRTSQISKRVHKFTLDSHMSKDSGTTPSARFGTLSKLFDTSNVVATTCFGVMSHPIFVRKSFDYVIVDEATQALQPVCLRSILAADKFILVGDPQQLTPIVSSLDAKNEGLSETLFDRLSVHKHAIVSLPIQYRMNKEITRLSNELTYHGALKCGTDAVANNRLSLPNPSNDIGEQWLSLAISSRIEDSVVFVNTAESENPYHSKMGPGLISNPLEISLSKSIVQKMLQAGVPATDIGIICVYRHQVKAMTDALHTLPCFHSSDVEVNTVDQYQGRDKPVILVSFVWASEGLADVSQGSDLLKDFRRINVLLTRAKQKLILIGHIPSLSQYEPMSALLNVLRDNQITNTAL